jgi:predicted nucleic acid-binding protein
MAIAVDTSVLIDHLRGDERALAALRTAVKARERLVGSVLTKVEVLAGMRPSEERATRRLLASLEWVAVDDEIAERAGDLTNRYLPSHPGVDPIDCMIAATVEHLGAELWTQNRKRFPMFPQLAPPY